MNALSFAYLLTSSRVQGLMLLPFCDLPGGLFLLLKIPKISPAPDLEASLIGNVAAHPDIIVPPSSPTRPEKIGQRSS